MRPRMPREDVLVGQGQRWDAVEGKGASCPGKKSMIPDPIYPRCGAQCPRAPLGRHAGMSWLADVVGVSQPLPAFAPLATGTLTLRFGVVNVQSCRVLGQCGCSDTRELGSPVC